MWRLRKISIRPNVCQICFVEKYFDSLDPKIHGPCNYLQSFYVAALIDEYGITKHYPLESFQLQMGFLSPFLRAKDLRSYLLNIRARSFLLSCT